MTIGLCVVQGRLKSTRSIRRVRWMQLLALSDSRMGHVAVAAVSDCRIILRTKAASTRFAVRDYLEMSDWLRSLKPAPVKTEIAHSLSSTCNARAAWPRGRMSRGYVKCTLISPMNSVLRSFTS